MQVALCSEAINAGLKRAARFPGQRRGGEGDPQRGDREGGEGVRNVGVFGGGKKL